VCSAAAIAGAQRPTGAPSSSSDLSITGTAIEHGRLKTSRGTWTGGVPIRYTYEWSRCDSSGGECEAIAGATKRTYRPVVADVGHRLVATVTATNAEGKGERTSSPSQTIAAAPPQRKGSPTLSGEFVDGRLVSVSDGVWKGTPPLEYSYAWQRCGHGGCSTIVGAAAQSYRVQTADIGYRIKAIVTARNAVGTGTSKTKSSAKVLPGSPLNLAPPSISGTILPGQVLSAEDGSWVGTPPIAFSYQWLACAPLGGCSEIPGATEQTHTVGAEEIGDSFEVTVTATNAQGSAAATSSETSVTGSGVQPPENVVAPLVTGLALTGQTLHASEGVWKGTEPAYAFQWELCNSAGAGCAPIEGATSAEYPIPDGDAGHTLRVLVTARNSAGEASATSEATTEVLGVAPSNTVAPTISGTAKEGQILTASSGTWTGTEPITYEYEWLRCNAKGEACTQAAGASVLPTYTAVAADVAGKLKVKVIAKNLVGKGEAESAAKGPVEGIVPTNAVTPLIVGVPTSGSTVTGTEGTWTGTQPIKYEYEWKLCSSATSCKVEQKSASNSFTIPALSSGKKLRLNVIAKNAAGEAAKEAPEVSIAL
jgi:hypothetical protein